MSNVWTYLRRNHLALVAIFIGLGGTSYAAFSLPANSVGTRQLKAHSVTPAKVSAAAVRLFRAKRGRTGPRGPIGLQGPKGDTGQPGQLGPTFGTSASREAGFFNACTPTTLVSKQFTLTQPGMVYIAPGGDGVYANGASNETVDYDIQLLDSTGTTTLADVRSETYMDWSNGLLGAPLPDGAIMPQTTGNGSPYIAAAGTYTAAITADVGAGGPCASTVTTIGPTNVSVIEIGNTS